jgi:hypothetical protein
MAHGRKARTSLMLHAARHPGIFRFALLGAALAGFVLALVLAAAPALHEQLHGDAGHVPHECLATVLHAGGCDDAAPAPTLASFVATLFEVAPLEYAREPGSLFLSHRILEHAPPRRA